MPRFVPPDLKAHLQGSATTTTLLLKITPATPGFSVYGVTLLDRDVDYDDGAGVVTYRAGIGMVPSSVIGYSDLTTDQGEAEHLLPEFDIPELSEEGIRAGAYDFAEYHLYLVNYEDLSQGHVTLKRGKIGRVTLRSDGLSFVNELRDLSAELKQTLCTKDSLSCRAIFGSQPIGSSIPGPQVTHEWCGFDATSLLVADEVSSVGLESTLTFTLTGPFVEDAGALVPGIVKFLSGANAGRTYEIADNTDDGTITLAIEADYPIEEGDELEYRVDCSKWARDDAKGCRKHFGPDWILHFRGEPDIPIGDESAMFTPGAGIGPGDGGAIDVPFAPQDEQQ